MQSMIRRALLALVAVLAVGVVASASASAATCTGTVEKGAVALCVEGKEQIGETAFTAKERSGTGNYMNYGGLVGRVFCYGNSTAGTLNGTTGKLEVKGTIVRYAECSVPPEEASCEVLPFIADGGEGKGTGPGLGGAFHTVSNLTLEGAGKEKRFSKLYVKSKSGKTCGLADTLTITGYERCELQEPTVEAITHRVDCLENKEGRSELFGEGEFGESGKWEFHQEMKLTSGKKWSLYSS